MVPYVQVSWPYAQLLQGKESTETKTRSKRWSQWDHWLRNILYYSSNTKGNSSPAFCYLEFLQPCLMVIKLRWRKEAWDKCGPKKKEHLHSRSMFFMNCSPSVFRRAWFAYWSVRWVVCQQYLWPTPSHAWVHFLIQQITIPYLNHAGHWAMLLGWHTAPTWPLGYVLSQTHNFYLLSIWSIWYED